MSARGDREFPVGTFWTSSSIVKRLPFMKFLDCLTLSQLHGFFVGGHSAKSEYLVVIRGHTLIAPKLPPNTTAQEPIAGPKNSARNRPFLRKAYTSISFGPLEFGWGGGRRNVLGNACLAIRARRRSFLIGVHEHSYTSLQTSLSSLNLNPKPLTLNLAHSPQILPGKGARPRRHQAPATSMLA